ncbi:MAG: DNA polymerase III subunit gamma/tau [Epsilonproteobacteria bacterium]|nr:DNA polymerase III subunit gamma/tau [Campylobacterota bacterium]
MSEVLALKYRPKTFEELIGQDSIAQVLTGALNGNRLSHAYLFSGLRGSGKTSTARIFAKALVCDNGPTAKPCEECENCKAANENRHIDIIEMDAASSRKIDDIRDLIEQTKYKPTMARYKIFIIDEVHMLTKEAFNALLKTLEEPPEYIKFILATTDPLKLPATILSRTQHFRFKRISEKNIKHHLEYILDKEGIRYESEALDMLSRSGNGSLRDTLTLLDQAIIYAKGYIQTTVIANMLGLIDPAYLDKIFDTVLNGDKKRLLDIIKELEEYESEVVIDEMIAYLKNSFFMEDARFSTILYDRFFRILSDAKNLLFINADSGFVLSLMFFKMVEATKLKSIDSLIESLEKTKTQTNPTHRTALPQNDTIDTKIQPENPKIPTDQDNAKKFSLLVKSIYDRNYETGECFEKSVSFIKFENDILELESCTEDKCKKTLRLASGVIKHLVKDIYGIETKISMKPCSKDISKERNDTPKKDEDDKKKPENEEPKDENPSCIASHLDNPDNNSKEENILDDPFIKKATELFNPARITVRRKV